MEISQTSLTLATAKKIFFSILLKKIKVLLRSETKKIEGEHKKKGEYK